MVLSASLSCRLVARRCRYRVRLAGVLFHGNGIAPVLRCCCWSIMAAHVNCGSSVPMAQSRMLLPLAAHPPLHNGEVCIIIAQREHFRGEFSERAVVGSTADWYRDIICA